MDNFQDSPAATGEAKIGKLSNQLIDHLSKNQLSAQVDLSLAVKPKVTFHAPTLKGVDARDGTANTRPLTELGNSYRIYDKHGQNLRYVQCVKSWLHWSDGAWRWDFDGAIVRRMASELPSAVYQEGIQHQHDAEHFAKWARSSQRESTINSAVSLLKDFSQVRIPLSLVDADAFLVGIDNGRFVVDLKNGTSRRSEQSDYVTKSLNVTKLGDPAKANRWELFLEQIFNNDSELIDWLKRWCGYLLTGSVSEHCFVFGYGIGSNGKSVLSEIISFIMGDYSRTVLSETLTESRRAAGAATPDIAELIGARLATSSETEDGVALAEALIKRLTGGDTMAARRLYSSQFEFKPQFKLMIFGNHKPIIRGDDYGIWRRVRLIPFNRIFKPEERDNKLLDKLKHEAPHILAWMVDGCLDWQKRGMSDIPLAIKQATCDYQEEQDLVGSWLDECCVLSSLHETPSTDLYISYKNWCENNGLRPLANVSLGRKLANKGFRMRRTSVRLWQGILIKNSYYGASSFD